MGLLKNTPPTASKHFSLLSRTLAEVLLESFYFNYNKFFQSNRFLNTTSRSLRPRARQADHRGRECLQRITRFTVARNPNIQTDQSFAPHGGDI